MPLIIKDEGTGPAVVFLHAFPLDGSMWQHNASAIRGSGFRTLLLDLPGFGDSPGEMESIAATAAAVEETMKSAGIAKAAICGLSMGGYVALELYLKAPDLFVGVILCDTTSESDSPEKKGARLAAIDEISVAGTAAFMKRLAETMVSGATFESKPAVAGDIFERFTKATPGSTCAALMAMSQRRSTTSFLGSIRHPVLLLFGGDDPMLDDGRMMASLIPGARLEVFRDAGHFSNLEAPQRFDAVLNRFLKEELDFE